MSRSSDNVDVFDAEEEAERAVAQMALLVAPVLLSFPAATRRSLIARVLVRVAALERVGVPPRARARVPAAAVPAEAKKPPRVEGKRPRVEAKDGESPQVTQKDQIELFLMEHPGATAPEVAEASYSPDIENRCERARVLLHQMGKDGRVVHVRGRSGVPGKWSVVPPEERKPRAKRVPPVPAASSGEPRKGG